MITDYFQASFLAIVQGISEFIPVSSSAHLIILSQFFGFSNQSIIFDVGLHLGSLIAIVFYFRNELLNLRNNKELLKLIIIGSTPLVIIGYILFYSGIINISENNIAASTPKSVIGSNVTLAANCFLSIISLKE